MRKEKREHTYESTNMKAHIGEHREESTHMRAHRRVHILIARMRVQTGENI